MRKLYEINHDIEDLLNAVTDPETGEVVDLDALDGLLLEREQKIENVILYRKDVLAEIMAVGTEIASLEKRYARLQITAEGLKEYIAKAVDGQNFKTERCEVTHRMSEETEVDPEFIKWAYEQKDDMSAFIKHTETDKADKTAIKKYLKSGGTLEHCRLVKKDNIQIK